MAADTKYPLSPKDWRIWLEVNLKISEEKGCELVIPKRLYLTIAHSGWKKMFESNHVRDRIEDRPYLV
jgi:hypothetical protein